MEAASAASPGARLRKSFAQLMGSVNTKEAVTFEIEGEITSKIDRRLDRDRVKQCLGTNKMP
jgi:hypothetical protein